VSYLKLHNFTTSYVFNIDETRTEPRENPSERFITPTKEGRTQYVSFTDLRTTANIISADGRCWLTVYIYKDDITSNPDRSGTLPVYHVQVKFLNLDISGCILTLLESSSKRLSCFLC